MGAKKWCMKCRTRHLLTSPHDFEVDLRGELAAYAIRVQLEKLVARAKRAGVLIVADSDAVAIRLIPVSAVREGVDLQDLGVTARVHNACGGGSSRVGGDPPPHG